MAKVLILGGTGRIGRAIAADLLSHTDTEITLGGRKVAGATIATAPSNLAERVQPTFRRLTKSQRGSSTSRRVDQGSE